LTDEVPISIFEKLAQFAVVQRAVFVD